MAWSGNVLHCISVCHGPPAVPSAELHHHPARDVPPPHPRILIGMHDRTMEANTVQDLDALADVQML